ncbi:hypothetical protein KL930_004484 [Ogataea haglerorum]|uniref:Zn(2)-C6 fungal-type domain-containing protein n=1 Tax=Ogataea haglerorum TaxID=1937702 RepID=A0AAN6D2F9_9ASCO|nr:hypothetical protein KL915_004579 [Ogataea haglerorum]KAG7725259.1 hypothetical protein KL933_004273 [Ogataea haglerorum]KAG7727331.1 hypothetical protein KL948_004480 [Ogataea haglerorum]KAG7736439.1 hypothetical protein KL923_004646 [Ogataea haglerorum]KAG7754909.1 hypothetical protein KL947_004687 [Ogataea haglerorum]
MPKLDDTKNNKQRKRNRVPISCTICRRRKVKCDKKKPECTNCIKNGVQHLCRYLEPSWAKPLKENELHFPGATVASQTRESSIDFVDRDEEMKRLLARIRELENENTELKRKKAKPGTSKSLLRSTDDLVDFIRNSNILFTAKKGPTYNFPIIYQISVFSWMFVVRNDSYLNDLWLKILKLRKHYEYYYSSKNAMVDASKSLETDYTNYDFKMSHIRQQNKNHEVPEEKSNEHTSKLKKFLETAMVLNKPQSEAKCPITGESGVCPARESPAVGKSTARVRKCPVLHPEDSSEGALNYSKDDDEEDEMEDPKVCPLMIGDARALFKEKLSRMSVSAIRDLPHSKSPKVTSISADVVETPTGTAVASPNTAEDEPALSGPQEPRSTIDGLQRLNKSNGAKKIKTISPSAIKNLNYNNTKQVIAVIEKHLPDREVVWLLIDRFFEKLYIHLPYVDEESFRARIASIIDATDGSSQRIRLGSIGSQYCEEFLNVCLLLIILRLSWLSLPSRMSDSLSLEEQVMMRPENIITMVLVDMVKEIFSSAKIMSKPSLIIFQVGLFLKLYNILSPEDGFDLEDSYSNTNTTLLNSNDLSGDLTNENPNMNAPNFMYMLIQLAKTIGLNRDPLNFKNFYPATDDPVSNARLFRKRHLWRKLWYGLLALSIESNLSLGDYKKGLPIEVDIDPTLGSVNRTWDCRLPGGVEQGVLEKSFNRALLEKEQLVVTNFKDSILVYHLLYKGMSILFSVDSVPTSRDFDQIMAKLLDLISDRSRIKLNMASFLNNEDETPLDHCVKIYRFKLHLVIKSMLFALNYLLFLNHEQKFNRLISDKSFTVNKLEKQKEYMNTYFESCLLLAVDNYDIFNQIYEKSDTLYPSCGSQLILYPYLLILNHRSHEFLISLILRLQQNSPIVMEILNRNNIDKDELLSRLFNYLQSFLDKLEDLTKLYYYAWRLKKMVKFFHNILANSTKLFNLNFKTLGESEQNKDEITLQTPRVSQPLQLHQTPRPIKREPTNAFEIAFGTSKLPPVTDFTGANDPAAQPAPEQVEPNVNAASMPDMFDDMFFTELSDINGMMATDTIPNPMMDVQQMGSPGHPMGSGVPGPGFHNSLNEIDFTNVDLTSQFDNYPMNYESAYPNGLGNLNFHFG